MFARFVTAACLVHAVLLLLAVAIGRRWQKRAATPLGLSTYLRLALVDALVFGCAALLLAAPAADYVGDPRFTLLRLLCQALFGEGALLVAWTALVLLRGRQRLTGGVSAAALGLLLAVYWDAYHVEPRALAVREHTIDLAHGRPWRQLRIVHLSDLQVERVGAHEERVLREVGRLRPDLVVLTGDYVQERLTPRVGLARAELRALLLRVPLEAPLGVFAVQGDVDEDWPAVFQGTPVRTLSDESAIVALAGGRSLALVGLAHAGRRAGRTAGC